MVAQVMATYGQSYQQVMSLPMRAFWSLNGFIPRIYASRALLDLQVAASAQGAEAAQSMAQRLSQMAPEPVKRTVKAVVYANAQRDEAGIAKLRAMTLM